MSSLSWRSACLSSLSAGLLVVLTGVLLPAAPARAAAPAAKSAATPATLAAVQTAADTLRALPLSGPTQGERSQEEVDAVVSAQLTTKVRALLTLDQLAAAVDPADPQRVDALVVYATSLEAYATDLRGAYVPSYLTAKEREQYREGLASRAIPPQQKALHVWQLVLDASGGPDRAATRAQAVAAITRLQATAPPGKPSR